MRSHRSADLAGRSVGIGLGVPDAFDTPLAPHHKLIGRWVAQRTSCDRLFSRPEARRHIERTFRDEVLAALQGIELLDLRALVLSGSDGLPPAICLICDTVGQIDLGWIEKANVLSNTLFGSVAPVAWRATAYQALLDTLIGPFPVFGFEDLLEELSAYYWDGETDDLGATKALIEWHGHDPADVESMVLPSTVRDRRPDFMLAENAAPLRRLPARLAQLLRRLRAAARAVRALEAAGNALRFDWHMTLEYLPHLEECSPLPPLTLVPFDHFQNELDDVARPGMEYGFLDVVGLCQLSDPGRLDQWFASLGAGAELLRAAQDLIDFDPNGHWHG